MCNPKKEITRSGVIVVESLRDDDRKTGRELYSDIIRYKKEQEPDFFCDYYPVNSSEEFISVLNRIHLELEEGDSFVLHFEMHGAGKGISINDSEVIPWSLFFDLIRPINIKMCHTLVIVMAVCEAGALISSCDIKKRAPYRAFVSPFENISSDVVARGFEMFYQNYNSFIDIHIAYSALCQEVDDISGSTEGSTFWFITEEEVLDKLFDENEPHFKHVVSVLSEGDKGMESELRKVFLETYKENKDFYCFKDVL